MAAEELEPGDVGGPAGDGIVDIALEPAVVALPALLAVVLDDGEEPAGHDEGVAVGDVAALGAARRRRHGEKVAPADVVAAGSDELVTVEGELDAGGNVEVPMAPVVVLPLAGGVERARRRHGRAELQVALVVLAGGPCRAEGVDGLGHVGVDDDEARGPGHDTDVEADIVALEPLENSFGDLVLGDGVRGPARVVGAGLVEVARREGEHGALLERVDGNHAVVLAGGDDGNAAHGDVGIPLAEDVDEGAGHYFLGLHVRPSSTRPVRRTGVRPAARTRSVGAVSMMRSTSSAAAASTTSSSWTAA